MPIVIAIGVGAIAELGGSRVGSQKQLQLSENPNQRKPGLPVLLTRSPPRLDDPFLIRLAFSHGCLGGGVEARPQFRGQRRLGQRAGEGQARDLAVGSQRDEPLRDACVSAGDSGKSRARPAVTPLRQRSPHPWRSRGRSSFAPERFPGAW
jgi:hypothetical protein